MEKFPLLRKVEISPGLLALYRVEKPKIAIETKEACWKLVFDFANIDPAEVDDALSALFESLIDYFVSQSGKVLVFDEENQRQSNFASGAKKLKGVR